MGESDFYNSPEGAKFFAAQLSQGHKWTSFIADKLNSSGVDCRVDDMRIAQTIEERKEFHNEQDIIFTSMNGCLEVKSQSVRFTDEPSSFPYKRCIVDTKLGWSRKSPRPLATVLVCIHTSQAIVVPSSTEHLWVPEQKYDRFRKINDIFLMADINLLKKFDELVDWLTDRQDKSTTNI